MATSCLITGATGFLGGHLAEACAARGLSVRALVRAGSNISLLEQAGVAVVRGDLEDSASLPPALEGVDVVFHCAAKVGDWGPVEDYRRVNVEGLRHLLEACKGRPLKRFVHFSSLGVYAARHHYGADESEPLPAQHADGYSQSKVESEQLALHYQREVHIPVVVLRPGFIYGPRDTIVLPRLIENLRTGAVRYLDGGFILGGGKRALNTIYVGNVVEAALLAMDKGVVGQVYNLTDDERVSRRRFIEGVADGMGVPKLKVALPLWFARTLVFFMERQVRRSGGANRPRLTQAGLKFLGLNLEFSIEKAKRELGYRPRFTFDEGMAQTIAWYKRPAGELAPVGR